MSSVRPLAVMVVALLPTVLLAWFLTDPARNQPILIRIEHFVITSNVSIVAALVAFLVARAALDVGHFRTLLIALGFGCMAGIFAVYGLSTPDVLQRGERAQPAGLVVAISGQLALAIAAVFFAVRYTPLAAWLERRVRPRVLTGAVVAGLAAYAALALGWPETVGGIARWTLVQAGSPPGQEPAPTLYRTATRAAPHRGPGRLALALVL